MCLLLRCKSNNKMIYVNKEYRMYKIKYYKTQINNILQETYAGSLKFISLFRININFNIRMVYPFSAIFTRAFSLRIFMPWQSMDMRLASLKSFNTRIVLSLVMAAISAISWREIVKVNGLLLYIFL